MLCDQLSPQLRRAFEAASERGALCWLTTLPIAEHGFALSKGEFHDALCLKFGWQPVNLPQTCVCGKPFCVEHAFTCPCGGFPSIRHNEVRDLTASLLSEVCSDVGVEPTLQPLDGEPLQFATANSEDGARLDVVARDFWGRNRQRAFFDVRVFNPFACSYFRSQLSRCYQLHEREKRWTYDERVREVERACFSPLVFAATGDMGPTATTVFRKLASMLAEKRSINYSKCLFWLRCRLCFSLLRSAVMCLRGHRSSVGRPSTTNVDLAYSEGRLESGGLV